MNPEMAMGNKAKIISLLFVFIILGFCPTSFAGERTGNEAGYGDAAEDNVIQLRFHINKHSDTILRYTDRQSLHVKNDNIVNDISTPLDLKISSDYLNDPLMVDMRKILMTLAWRDYLQQAEISRLISDDELLHLFATRDISPSQHPLPVFNAKSGLTVAIALLLVFPDHPPAEITQQPESLVVLEKNPATFTVEASGEGLRYQWQVDGVDIPGAKKASYTIAATELLDHGKRYRCIVRNPGGTVTSQEAELQVDMDIPPNEVAVVGLEVAWDQDKAVLTWQGAGDELRYQVRRGAGEDTTEPIGESGRAAYEDKNTAYYYHWTYRLASIRDYIHPVSKKVYHAIGPLSAPVRLSAQSMPAMQFPDAQLQADGSYQATYIVGTNYKGAYTNLNDPIIITATGPGSLNANGSAGSFTLPLPAPGTWQIRAVESGGYRTAAGQLHLIVDDDTTAPRLILHSAAEISITATTVSISGEAHDSGSGLKSIHVISDQYGSTFSATFDSNGFFVLEVPVKTGVNHLTVVARDRSGNEATAAVAAEVSLPALPQLTITAPAHGETVTQDSITVSGTVRSSLPADQIRLLFDGQVYFPEGSEGNYQFTFTDVHLHDGENTIRVTAESVYGSVSAQVLVVYQNPDDPDDPDDPEDPGDPGDPEIPGPPSIEIFTPLPNAYLSSADFEVSGIVTGDADITSITVNGQAAAVTGSGARVSFQASLDFGAQQQLDILLVANDAGGESTTLSYTVYHDDGAPVIELSHSFLQDAPHVNTVVQTPFSLQGTVSDANLAGFSINDTSFGLLPLEEGRYAFNADLNPVRGQENLFTLKAWDKGSNSSSRALVIRLDSGLDIDIITPAEGAELYTESDTVRVEIAMSIDGLAESDQVGVSLDGQAVSGLMRNGPNIHGDVARSMADGEHRLVVNVVSPAGATLARTSRNFIVTDVRLLPLTLLHQEPGNNETGAPNNGFIGFYFNKPLDPALLSVEVLETFHGKDYGAAPQGTDLTGQSGVEMVEVHRDRDPVAGSLSHFPAKTMAAFYPERTFAFGATVFVSLSYDGEEFASTTFRVKSLPTFIQGFLVDQFHEPIEGMTVSLPDLGRSAITDKDGSYSFGFGDTADESIPPGRYKAVANSGLAMDRFGSMEFWVNVESGRLNEVGLHTIAVLNVQEPFRYLNSAEPEVILAAGELNLDLSEATLEFADGKNSGNVHAQFMTVDEQPYDFIQAGAPQWVFHLNPNGIHVQGNVGVRIKMPAMMGSYEYVHVIGEHVVLVGLDDRSLTIVPVGVGRVDADARLVINEGNTNFNRLDIVGYGLVDQEYQPLLEAFSNHKISLSEMISRLSE